jgi:hypothetical protein
MVEFYDGADWNGADPIAVEKLAYLLGVSERSASAAVAVMDKFHSFVIDQQRAGGGNEW